MKKTGLLLLVAMGCYGQYIHHDFVGHVVACGPGFAIFDKGNGELVNTSSAVDCNYYARYTHWRVYTEPGGAHPDHVVAIEPSPAEWEYSSRTMPTRRWKRGWFRFKRPTHSVWKD